MRRLAPSLVITLALVPACAKSGAGGGGKGTEVGGKGGETEPPERTWVEFRNGVCHVQPDCSPIPGSDINPCNPPPPVMKVDCPKEMLPTPPPELTITTQDDGTCWVDCDADKCDAPGPLRVRCLDQGEAATTYASGLVVPTATSARYDTGVFHRRADLHCDLAECEAGTKCASPPGRNLTDVPCPPELVPKVAKGVVPILSSTRYACFFGRAPVECPKRFHVWH